MKKPATCCTLCACAASDKSRAVVHLRNVMMELRKVVNHPCLLGLDLETPAYIEAVKQRNAAAAAALEAKGVYPWTWGSQHWFAK